MLHITEHSLFCNSYVMQLIPSTCHSLHHNMFFVHLNNTVHTLSTSILFNITDHSLTVYNHYPSYPD